jgi:hypothetical protein
VVVVGIERPPMVFLTSRILTYVFQILVLKDILKLKVTYGRRFEAQISCVAKILTSLSFGKENTWDRRPTALRESVVLPLSRVLSFL